MWLIGYPGAQVLEDRPDDASVNAAFYQGHWPGCVAVQFSGTFADLSRFGPEPSKADFDMTGGHDLRPYAMPVMTGEALASAVKAECSRRIYERLSAEEQMNMATALPDAKPEVAAVIRAVRKWVGDMRTASKAMIAANDAAFTPDAKWPAWDATWDGLVASF